MYFCTKLQKWKQFLTGNFCSIHGFYIKQRKIKVLFVSIGNKFELKYFEELVFSVEQSHLSILQIFDGCALMISQSIHSVRVVLHTYESTGNGQNLSTELLCQ